jgi:hypothetical protein
LFDGTETGVEGEMRIDGTEYRDGRGVRPFTRFERLGWECEAQEQ